MRLGMSTASLYTNVPTEDCFDIIKGMGIDLCEVFLSSHSEYSGAIGAQIIKNRSIEVHSIHALTNQFEPELFSMNMRSRQDSLDVLARVLDMGQALKAKHYTFHGATMLKRKVYDHDYDRLAKLVNEVIEQCKLRGLTLNYETVHWTYFSQPDYFRQLKLRCSELRATLDIKQAMQSNIPYTDYLEVVKDRLDTVHLCDYDNNGKLHLPGKGSFDFVELFARLLDVGFQGGAIIEVYPSSYNNFDQLAMSYDYISECREKAMALAK